MNTEDIFWTLVIYATLDFIFGNIIKEWFKKTKTYKYLKNKLTKLFNI